MATKKPKLTYAQVNKLVKAYDAKIALSDFSGVVVIQHQDGSYLSYHNAVAMEKEGWVAVFSEHCGFQVFARDDLDGIRVFRPDYKKLKSL